MWRDSSMIDHSNCVKILPQGTECWTCSLWQVHGLHYWTRQILSDLYKLSWFPNEFEMMIPKQKQVGCDNVISFFLEFELLKALTHFKRHFKIFTHAATISAAIFSKALFGSQHR